MHHIVPIARVGKEYRLNPVTDLQPVCPNCHAVIHRREPPYSIDAVRKMLQKEEDYRTMAADEVREGEALEWAENLAGEVRDEAR